MTKTSEMLLKIYDNIKSWLEYAEKKNLVLFTIMGSELAIIKFMVTSTKFKYIEIALIFLFLAFIITLFSFYPKTERLLFIKRSKKNLPTKNFNLFFYGDIKNINLPTYLKLLQDNYKFKIENDKLSEDICDQIVILSQIANFKFSLFKIAIYFAIIGHFILFISLLVNILFVS